MKLILFIELCAINNIMLTNDDYRSFFENAPIGFWRTKIEDGQFLMANAECAAILGYPSIDQLLQAKSVNLYVNGHREKMLAQLKSNRHIKDYEIQLNRPDGTTVWLSVTAHLTDDYIEGAVEDITHEKQLTEQISILKQQELEKLNEMQKGIKKRLKDISLAISEGQHTS